MYLVGDLSYSEYFKGMGYVKVKKEITKEDLGKSKTDSAFQIINLDTLEFFDSEKNAWIKFDEG